MSITTEMKIPWLRQLENDSPIINSFERKYIEDVYSATEKEIRENDLELQGDNADAIDKISVIEENLKVIVHRLRLSQEAKQRFINEYPKWEKVRRRNIQSLETIANSLHSTRKNCNISRLVGSCTSVVGGGMIVASVVLTPLTLGATAPLAVTGGAVSFLGSAASAGATVAEIAKMRNKVKEANSILQHDKDSFEILKSWLTHATELSNALESILTLEEDERLEGIMQMVREFAEVIFSSKNKAEKNEMINLLVKSAIPRIPRELIHSTLTANLISLLLIISLLCKRNHVVFESATKTLKIVSNIVSLADFSVDVFRTASNFIKNEMAITANVSKAVTKGAVAMFGVTLDVASIVLTSLDVRKGSLSGQGLKIRDIAEKLKEESDILVRVYNELHGREDFCELDDIVPEIL